MGSAQCPRRQREPLGKRETQIAAVHRRSTFKREVAWQHAEGGPRACTLSALLQDLCPPLPLGDRPSVACVDPRALRPRQRGSMGRTVAADGSIEEQAERIRASAGGSIQVGLLLGKSSASAAPPSSLSAASTAASSAPGFGTSSGSSGASSGAASKDVLLALLPTPPAPDGSEGGASASGALNGDWVQEHARQVLRMTCGGISLLGLFVCCTDSLYKTHHPDILQALGAVGELVAEEQRDATALAAERSRLASPTARATAAALSLQGQGPAPEMLLLHICSKPKRLTLFTLPSATGTKTGGSKGGSAGQLVAAELRPNPQALSSLLELRTVHQVDACIPMAASASKAKSSSFPGSPFPHLRAAVERLLRSEAQALAAAEVATGPLLEPAAQGGVRQDLRLFQDADGTQLSNLMGGDAGPGPNTSSSTSGAGKGRSQGKGGGKGGGGRSSSAAAEQGAPGAVLHTQLLRPPPWAALAPSGDEESIDAVAGVLRVCGTVTGVAVAGPRDSAATAFWSLKVDVLRTLRARLDVLVEDAEEALEASGEGEGTEGTEGTEGGRAGEAGREQGAAGAEADILRLADMVAGAEADTRVFRSKWPQGHPLRLALPRRLLLPWRPGAVQGQGQGGGGKGGALPLSDYALPHEGEEDCLERLRAMLPLGDPGHTGAAQEALESLLMALEPAPPALAPALTQGPGCSAGAGAFWRVATPEGAQTKRGQKLLEPMGEGGGGGGSSSSALLLGSALVVAMLAVLVALYLSLA